LYIFYKFYSNSSEKRTFLFRQAEFEILSLNRSEKDGNEIIFKKIVGIDITKVNFNPRLFLSIVHKKPDFKTIESSKSNLEKRIVEQQEEIKHLVSENLEKFISVKDLLDNIYNNKDELFRGNFLSILTDKFHGKFIILIIYY
jgi:hypothetical protein